MTKDNNAFKAGLFIVAAIILAAGLLVALQGSRAWFEPMRDVTAAFELTENLGGLKPGDPVRVGGYDQGHVTAVRYVADPAGAAAAGAHMEVDFTLPKKYDLRGDALIGVEQALTGQANLNLSDFGHAAPWKEGQPLDGRPSPLTTFYTLAPELQALVHEVRAKVQPAYDRYDHTVAHADDAVVEAKKAMAAFSDFLGGSGPDLRGTLANLNHATDTLHTRLPVTLDKADKFIDDTKAAVADVRSTVQDFHSSLADAKAALANARSVTEEARGVLLRNRSRIDHILESTRDTASNLEGASAEIRRSPWRLLYKPSPEEAGNLTLYDTTRQFARAAAQLNDAAGAVRDAAADPTIDRKQLQSLLTDLQQTFSKYHEAEQTFWQAVK